MEEKTKSKHFVCGMGGLQHFSVEKLPFISKIR